MITVNKVITALQNIVKLNPRFGDVPAIYSSDEEGNSFRKVLMEATLTQVYDIEEHDLDVVGYYEEGNEDISLEDCNCVIIN